MNEYVDLINIMSLNLYYLYLIQYIAPNEVLYASKFVPAISQLTGIVSIALIYCIKFMIVLIDALGETHESTYGSIDAFVLF